MRWSWLLWWRPPAMLRVCIVNLKDDHSTAIKGVLWQSRGPWLTFRDCSLLRPSQPATPIDGDVFIHRDNVSFLQAVA